MKMKLEVVHPSLKGQKVEYGLTGAVLSMKKIDNFRGM